MTYSVGDKVALRAYKRTPVPLIGVITLLDSLTVGIYWFNTGNTAHYDRIGLGSVIVAYVEPKNSL
jgi:hypothetical protein